MKNKKLLLFLALVIAILFMTVGYASIDSITGEITGNAIAKLQDGVFITDVEYVSDNEAKVNSSKIEKFVGTMMKSTVELSDTNVDSSITYKVTVYNSYADTAVFSDVLYGDEFYDNTDITFEITGFKPGEKIGPSENKDIIITFKYSGTTVPSNNVLNSYLNFKITVPNRMVAGSKATNYLKGNIARNNIETITFKLGKKSDIPVTKVKSQFDASEKQDESIIGYYTDENNDGMYDLTFLSLDTIFANKNASYLFNYLSNLKSIDFDNFKTDDVTNMSGMFSDCKGLTSLDVSNFDTSNVTNMDEMFYNCNKLVTIYVTEYDSTTGKGWTTVNVTDSSNMFNACSKLVGGNGTVYDSSNTDATYARIDTAENPGYLTKKNQ